MAMFSDMPTEIIILSANKYDSQDISGCSVFYTFDVTMEENRDDINTVGNVPAKVWGPKELFEQIPVAPAKYIASFTMRMKKNVPTLYLESVRYLNRVRLVDDITSAAAPEPAAPAEAGAAGTPEAAAARGGRKSA